MVGAGTEACAGTAGRGVGLGTSRADSSPTWEKLEHFGLESARAQAYLAPRSISLKELIQLNTQLGKAVERGGRAGNVV